MIKIFFLRKKNLILAKITKEKLNNINFHFLVYLIEK